MISIEMKQRRTIVFSLLLFTIVLSLVLAASPLEAQTTVWDPSSTLAFSQGGTATAATGELAAIEGELSAQEAQISTQDSELSGESIEIYSEGGY